MHERGRTEGIGHTRTGAATRHRRLRQSRRLQAPTVRLLAADDADRSRHPTEANTLYPLLRRLEKQGLLTAEWNTEQARPRKYYTLTDSGAEVAAALHSHWLELDSSITKLWKDGTP
jgi:hypothetical protein